MKNENCTYCGDKLENNNFIPKTSRCRKCDAIISGSRHYYEDRTGRRKKNSRALTYKKLVGSLEKKIATGDTESRILDWIREYLPEVGISRERSVHKLYFFVWTNTDEGRSKLTSAMMSRLKELYNTKVSNRPLGRHSSTERNFKHPCIWPEDEGRDASGKVKLRKKIIDSGA